MVQCWRRALSNRWQRNNNNRNRFAFCRYRFSRRLRMLISDYYWTSFVRFFLLLRATDSAYRVQRRCRGHATQLFTSAILLMPHYSTWPLYASVSVLCTLRTARLTHTQMWSQFVFNGIIYCIMHFIKFFVDFVSLHRRSQCCSAKSKSSIETQLPLTFSTLSMLVDDSNGYNGLAPLLIQLLRPFSSSQ